MKTVRIEDETHELLKNKVKELKDQYGVDITIESIANSVLKNGLTDYTFSKK